MKIRDKIIESMLKNVTERCEKMIEIGGPAIIIENLKKEIGNLKNGILKVKDKENLLDLEFNDIEWKKGRDGAPYATFNNSTINYFPCARYGAFITKDFSKFVK